MRQLTHPQLCNTNCTNKIINGLKMNQEIHRKNTLQKLQRIIKNEDNFLKTVAKRSSILKVSGLALVIASILECFSSGMPSWVILAQGLTGSILMCIGIILMISIRDWLTLREFLNHQAILETADREIN